MQYAVGMLFAVLFLLTILDAFWLGRGRDK